ncbi:hypothetical protein [Actinoplanes sp. NPDC048796]|uniref:hypothetical protein n=1 Tax=Actinoplanes sp. NPDC048796 TaxID=3155640 RepID=UPI00340CB5FA
MSERAMTPPSRHHMAVMIWLAVFPTLTVLQFLLGPVLRDAPIVLRTLVFASVAVPIVIYGLMPLLQRLRVLVLAGRRGK